MCLNLGTTDVSRSLCHYPGQNIRPNVQVSFEVLKRRRPQEFVNTIADIRTVTKDVWKVAKLESNSCSMEFRSRYSLQESRDMEGEVKAKLWNKNSASSKPQCSV